jgi:hypothetical protein
LFYAISPSLYTLRYLQYCTYCTYCNFQLIKCTKHLAGREQDYTAAHEGGEEEEGKRASSPSVEASFGGWGRCGFEGTRSRRPRRKPVLARERPYRIEYNIAQDVSHSLQVCPRTRSAFRSDRRSKFCSRAPSSSPPPWRNVVAILRCT